MKIKSINPNVVSMKLIVPIDGLITIDAEGVAEVSPKCAAILVKNTNDWNFVSKDEPEDESDGEKEVDERAEFEAKIKTAKKAELVEMCKEAGLPEEEWGKLTRDLLAAYLLKAYDAADAKTDENDDEEDE